MKQEAEAPYQTYLALSEHWEQLKAQGQEESEAAERLLDRMDRVWYRLTEAEMEQLRKELP